MASGASFGVDATTTFTNGDGHASGAVSLKNTGTFSDAGTFDEGSGTISGNDPTVTGSLNYEAGAGAGAIEAPPNSTVSLSGNISSGQTLLISGLDACSGGIPPRSAPRQPHQFGDRLRYHGTCTYGTPQLTVPTSDSITNGPSGTIEMEGPRTRSGNVSRLVGNVVNDGTFDGHRGHHSNLGKVGHTARDDLGGGGGEAHSGER